VRADIFDANVILDRVAWMGEKAWSVIGGAGGSVRVDAMIT
jgi:hypothetical protein